MALRLVGEDEIKDVLIDGTTFKVHVRPGHWFSSLRAEHAAAGRFDEVAYSDAVWAGVLVGWDRLENADGSEIPYSPEAAARAGRWMRDDVESKIFTIARARERKESEALGN